MQKVEKVGCEIFFPKHHTYSIQSPHLLSPFCYPKSLLPYPIFLAASDQKVQPLFFFLYSSFFVLLCMKRIGNLEVLEIWKMLWKSKMHERLKLLLGRIICKSLPVWEILSKRFLIPDISCLVCGEEVETVEHVFIRCPITVQA